MSKVSAVRTQGGAIRLTLPARVAINLDSLQGALLGLAERTLNPQWARGRHSFFVELEPKVIEHELEASLLPFAVGSVTEAVPQVRKG